MRAGRAACGLLAMKFLPGLLVLLFQPRRARKILENTLANAKRKQSMGLPLTRGDRMSLDWEAKELRRRAALDNVRSAFKREPKSRAVK